MIDTHCHIHESGFYKDDREAVYQRAIAANVAMICVGTSEQSSREAVEFVATHDGTWAIIGVHPHESQEGWGEIEEILRNLPLPSSPILERSELDAGSTAKIIGIGEIGLDYFYNHSPRDIQIRALEAQLQLACDYNLPVSFHVREAYDDFWPIFANFHGVHGVLHSFTDSIENLEKALSLELAIGVNGISTFARDKQAMFDAVPLESMLLETDAPFLTPTPLRGKVNEPAFVREVARYHAERRHIPLDEISAVTSTNARRIFSI
ncbi:MAG TPA: TatD family hydrolase [Candidatus Saccharimonadaceae bacterium]|nr:TatD family hydrolase [Candidatus Saccharimonadaceae bacterium]